MRKSENPKRTSETKEPEKSAVVDPFEEALKNFKLEDFRNVAPILIDAFIKIREIFVETNRDPHKAEHLRTLFQKRIFLALCRNRLTTSLQGQIQFSEEEIERAQKLLKNAISAAEGKLFPRDIKKLTSLFGKSISLISALHKERPEIIPHSVALEAPPIVSEKPELLRMQYHGNFHVFFEILISELDRQLLQWETFLKMLGLAPSRKFPQK